MAVPPLDHKAKGYSLQQAYWLGQAAKLAYSEEAEIRATTASWGFDRFRHYCSTHRMPFPIEDTQAYTVASDQMIITAFRGTQPLQICDWLSDVTTPPVPGPGGKGLVHVGFNQALRCVYPEIRDTIEEFRDNNQTIWFTGHSLGGALAMLAGATLYFEEPNLLPDGVYTFGQPRTCDRTLAKAHDSAFTSRLYRFVNNNDIVAHAPPEPVFHHVEALKYFDADGELHDRLPLFGVLRDKAKGLTADLLAPGTDTVRDHLMDRYLANIEKNLA